MIERLQGAAAGAGGTGIAAIAIDAMRSYFADEREAAAEAARLAADTARQVVDAAGQESMVELLKVMAARCSGGG
jgi:hypothetical protein